MTVESAVYINTLNSALPPGTDPKGEGDDHLRLIKSVLKATFPNNSGPLGFLYDNTQVIFPVGFRIKGDMSNPTNANRLMFQNSVANSPTVVGAIPSGTGTQSNFNVYASSDPDNATVGQLLAFPSDVRVGATYTGTGAAPSLSFYTGGASRYSITSAGQHWFAGSNIISAIPLVLTAAVATSGAAIQFSPGSSLRYFLGWDSSNFTLNRYNASGTYQNTPFYVRDTDGAVIFGTPITTPNISTSGLTVNNGILCTGNSIELGPAAAGPAYIDFHSGGGSTDYDTRLIATGGNTTLGNGSFDIYTSSLNLRAAGGYIQLVGTSGLCNLRFLAGSYMPFMRSNSSNSTFEWVNSANSAINMTLNDGGYLTTRSGITSNGGMTVTGGGLTVAGQIWIQGANAIKLDGGGYFGLLRGDVSGLVGFINQAGNAWTMQIKDAGYVKAMNGFIWGDESNLGLQYNGAGSIGGHTEASAIVQCSNNVNLYLGHTGGGGTLQWFGVSGVNVGTISCNTSITSYNTSSDYRLKKNVQDLKGCLDRILQCRPVSFLWRIDEKEARGFIAHELAEVEPDAVYGEKDAMTRSPDGKEIIPNYQGTDTSFVIPDIVGGMQELKQMLDAALARISVLEAK